VEDRTDPQPGHSTWPRNWKEKPVNTQQLSRDINKIQAYCNLGLADDGKIVFSEQPGITWKQQWEIDCFRAAVAADNRAKEVVRRYIQEATEALRKNSGRSGENSGQEVAKQKPPVPASPSETRSTPVAPPPASRQALQEAISSYRPTQVEVDIADAMLSFIAKQSGPVSEDDILAAVSGDEALKRRVLYRLAVDQIVERRKGGGYRIPPDRSRENPGLPDHCLLKKGGRATSNCALAPSLSASVDGQCYESIPWSP